MGTKRDMIIDYDRSNRKRGKRGKKHNWFFVFLILILICIGLIAFITIKEKIYAGNNRTDNPKPNTNVATITPKNEPTKSPARTPSIMPTTISTITPIQVPSEEADSLEVVNRREPTVVKGIYLTANTVESVKMNDILTMVETSEINALVIDVKGDEGKISYDMDHPVAKEIGAVTNTISDINALISTLKSKNIYLIARVVAFKDPYLAEKRNDLAIRNKDGSLFRDNNGECWVNPYNKEVWDYLIEVSKQAAAVGFDEIQFDYIRFSTGKGIAEADFGEDAKTKSKEEIITEFTKYAYKKIKPLGVYMSADVYGTIISSSIDAGLVGQNYVEMSKYLDYICPMIYPSHFGAGNYGIEYPDLEPYNIIRKVLTASLMKLDQIPEGEHRAIVRPWLQDFTATWVKNYMEYGGEELRQQIEGVYSVGYSEWLLWNAACIYSEDGLLEE